MQSYKGSYKQLSASLLLVAAAMLSMPSAHAGLYNDGKVLATGGVSMIDGAGGGGITPWATITGYETRDGINGDVHYTYASLPNYSLNSLGFAIGFYDRVELSYSNDVLPTGSTFDTVGLLASTLAATGASDDTGIEPFNTTIKMDVYGVKVRVLGEAIYDSDNLIPQISVGAFYKKNHNSALLRTLKANKTKDYELYASFTKIFFPLDLLVNVTARYTAANQTGLTGFGGPSKTKREIRPEVSLAYLLAKNTAIGAEWAKHGRNTDGEGVDVGGTVDTASVASLAGALGGVPLAGTLLGTTNSTLTQRESDWYDVFFAYLPNKNISLVFAYAMLGNITLTPNQSGYYFSVQASF